LVKIVKVEKVIRDEFNSAIWVRVKYIEESGDEPDVSSKILHDAVFMPDSKRWVFIHRRVIDNFIPPKRYIKMARKAAAIIYDRKAKSAEQQDLPLENPE
jgi:uncharacterized protein (DUF2225 family)